MVLKDKIKGLFKREVTKTDMAAIFERHDLESFFNNSLNLWHPSELIKKIGGYQNFEILEKDAEIFSAIDKRITALLDTRLIIKGDDEKLVKFFEEQLLPFEDQLKRDFWWTQFNGWGVEQIIYNEDRSGRISGFIREDFWRFEPMPDLIHVTCRNTIEERFRDKLLPYGKYVLTTNGGTYSNPRGKPLAEKLIAPWYFACTSDDLWLDFAKRFANGFMHAKIEDMEQKDVVRSALEKSGKSAILVTDKESELNLIAPPRDSSLYLAMNDLAARKIQKVVLGETLTSDMAVRGGSASATIHNEVRLEKTKADIELVQRAIDEIILQVSLVNGFISSENERDKLPYTHLIFDPTVNLELAERDATLAGAGVKFTKKYYKENYGFDDDDFEIVDQVPSNSFFSANNKSEMSKKSLFLKPEEAVKFIGNSSCCNKHQFENVGRKDARITDEIEEIIKLTDRNTNPPIDPDALVAAILSSKNESDLDEKLLALFDSRNNDFSEDMTHSLYLASVRGAMVGSSEVIKDE